MSCEIVIPSYGVEIEIKVVECKEKPADADVIIDLSIATSIVVEIKGKTGDKKIVGNHELVTDGTDGLIKFLTINNQIDEKGIWIGEVTANFIGSSTPSHTFTFEAIEKKL